MAELPRLSATTRGFTTLSIVTPAYQEHENLPVLLAEIAAVLPALAAQGHDAEVIVVDDGSEPPLRVAGMARARVIRQSHMGMSSAVWRGVWEACGGIIVTLDADLQNDPADIPALVAELERTGAGMVCGVRASRQDSWLRRASSRIANAVRRAVLRDGLRDTGCTLRAFLAPVRQVAFPRFDGAHRFVGPLAVRAGVRVIEREVNHRPRRFGRSHFGVRNRLPQALADLFGVWWLSRRQIPLEPGGGGSPSEELEAIRAYDAAKALGGEAIPLEQAVAEIENGDK